MKNIVSRFLPKVNRHAAKGCWQWTGAITKNGKGIFRLNDSVNVAADRMAYKFATGKWPKGNLVHVCGNPACVQIHPDHVAVATPEIRFWMKVNKKGKDGCWLWTGMRTWNRYGFINSKATRLTRAHYMAYRYLVGPIPDGMELYHRCKNRHCIRIHPDHVVLGTRAERTQNSVDQGWIRAGERHGMAKLTWANVRKIRAMYGRGYSQAHLGRMFGVYASTISRIVSGKNWQT